jgi:predicted AAA+ superfamily ATPase
MTTLVRADLLNKLLALKGTPDIKILTGIRRAGKSTLMREFIRVCREQNPSVNVVYIDLTQLEQEALKEYHALYAYVGEHLREGAQNVLCIDEVQLCEGFELAINSLHARGAWDIYLTGSNAFLLSSDLATLFTGRYMELHVFPFSFREYLTYQWLTSGAGAGLATAGAATTSLAEPVAPGALETPFLGASPFPASTNAQKHREVETSARAAGLGSETYTAQDAEAYAALRPQLDELFDTYAREGGMAGALAYQTPEQRLDYLRSVYTTIANRDLMQKRPALKPETLSAITEYLLDNVGNLTSASNIASTLALAGSHVTAGTYLHYLCETFLFYQVKRYDIKGKRYLATTDKFYVVDPGFRTALLGTRNLDTGRVYENLVAIELLRRGWDIYVGKLYKKEVDFVAMRRNVKLYVQVCDSLDDAATLERESSSLLAIRDAWPKVIIARTRHAAYTYEGIQVYDIARWLAGDLS